MVSDTVPGVVAAAALSGVWVAGDAAAVEGDVTKWAK